MIKALVIATAAALISSAASAAPVYLNCTLEDASGVPWKWTLSMNEEAGTVTYSHPESTATASAVFTPDFVTWAQGAMKVDRTTLEFTRTIAISLFSDEKTVTEGQCALAGSRDRAF